VNTNSQITSKTTTISTQHNIRITINIVRPTRNDGKSHAFAFLHNMPLFYVCADLRSYTPYKVTYQSPKESTWN